LKKARRIEDTPISLFSQFDPLILTSFCSTLSTHSLYVLSSHCSFGDMICQSEILPKVGSSGDISTDLGSNLIGDATPSFWKCCFVLFIFAVYLDPSSIIYGRGSRGAQRRYTQKKSRRRITIMFAFHDLSTLEPWRQEQNPRSASMV
jgi:hypothetical protein